MGRVRAAVVAVLLLAAVAVAQDVAAGVVMELMMNTIRSRDGSLVGLGTRTATAVGGSNSFVDRAKGFAGPQRDRLFTPESCVSMNTMSEVLVAYAAIKLRDETRFAESMDSVIDPSLSPAGLELRSNGQRLTYKMLLTHTSTINDALFGAAVTTAPNAVGSLTAFVESYFVTTGGQLNSAVFSNGEPGTAAAYSHARANTALMAYILERVIAQRSHESQSLKRYIVNVILRPFGMASTFFLENTGAFPGVTPPPSYSDAATYSLATNQASVYGGFFAGCAADDLNSRQLHPAWAADFMGVTTVNDILRLARGLFMDQTNRDTGLIMQQRILLTSTTVGTVFPGQVAQGMGLMYFNGDVLCASATATRVINTCPVTNQSTVVGFVAARGASLVGFLCTNPGASTGYVCTASAFVHGSSNAASFDAVFQATGAAYQDTFGSVTVVTAPPTQPLRTQDEEDVFGVLVFFGVFLSIATVFFGTMIFQYCFLPASLSRVTNTNAFTVGAGSRLSPQRRPGPLGN